MKEVAAKNSERASASKAGCICTEALTPVSTCLRFAVSRVFHIGLSLQASGQRCAGHCRRARAVGAAPAFQLPTNCDAALSSLVDKLQASGFGRQQRFKHLKRNLKAFFCVSTENTIASGGWSSVGLHLRLRRVRQQAKAQVGYREIGHMT